MPGKVVSIPVQPGDELKAGDIAIVLEAMKMQSNYKVSSDCRVKNILVTEGEAVQDNQTLIELELRKEKNYMPGLRNWTNGLRRVADRTR